MNEPSIIEDELIVEPKKNKKKKKNPSNRFNIERLKVSNDLDGVILASFHRRFFAFGIDLLVLTLFSYFWWTILLAYLFMKLSKRKLRLVFRRISTSIGWKLRSVDQKLDDYEVEDKLKGNFKKHLKFYLYIVMYLPLPLALIVGYSFFSNFYKGINEDKMIIEALMNVFNSYSPIDLIISGIASISYFGFMNSKFDGQTIGKRIMRIRVLKLNGSKITFWGSIERATGYAASGSLFLYGFFQFFWDPCRQTTHDKITETIVVRD